VPYLWKVAIGVGFLGYKIEKQVIKASGKLQPNFAIYQHRRDIS
jgi:hypothetical protein